MKSNTTFNDVINNRIESIKSVLCSKAKEYAKDNDRFYNFKRASEISRTTPEKALLGMMMKHIVSVIDLIEKPNEITKYLINEKIGDNINYLILLEGLLLEKLDKEN